ncbi:MAG: hypothetical protein BWY63_01858 [Chloroflexi bacterium ADurb.Bin360]|nr:MAG: hypothetical protein BWY63_01858 [Chloroflexi bacterium ADurb.Bin360]
MPGRGVDDAALTLPQSEHLVHDGGVDLLEGGEALIKGIERVQLQVFGQLCHKRMVRGAQPEFVGSGQDRPCFTGQLFEGARS